MKTIDRVLALGWTSTLALIVAAPAAAEAGDWPQWRGPDRTGVSTETGWSAVAKDESLWKKHIGFGHSSFAVADGRLFALGFNEAAGEDVLFCLDPETGADKWRMSYPAEHWNEGHDGGTCTTPTVDGNTVYISNREGRLHAVRADTGSVLWQHDMVEELEVTPPRWGFSGSPLPVGDQVIANVGNIAAFDKKTGEFRWMTEKAYGNAYSTPIEYTFNGTPAILALNGLGLAVISQADGTELAFHAWTMNPERAIYGGTPIVDGTRIFISASSGGGCVMLEPNEANELEVVWESRVMRTDYAGCVLYEGHLYGFDQSILKCIDLDGNEKWRRRGIGLGAVVVAGGRLVVLGAKGELIIAEATPEKYIELSRNKVLEGGAYWATPVLSHGLVYARNSLGDMVCRDYRGGADASRAASVETPDVLPTAESLLARHVESVGGEAALRGLSEMTLTGDGEQHGAGPIEFCTAQMAWSADGTFIWRFPEALDFGYTPDASWSISIMGTQTLEPDQIEEIREVVDPHRMLTPGWGFETMETIEARVFDDRACYVVNATLENGAARTLYFEVETGRLAGREGEGVPLWTFNDYRAVDGGLTWPMEWSMFAAGSGKMSLARFSAIKINDVDPEALKPPQLIQMMSRSAEDKEAANETLRAKYDYLTGSYAFSTGSWVGGQVVISIAEGGIMMSMGPQPPDYMTEPDDEGRLFVMSNPKIYIATSKADDGELGIVVWAYGDEFGRLERTTEDE